MQKTATYIATGCVQELLVIEVPGNTLVGVAGLDAAEDPYK